MFLRGQPRDRRRPAQRSRSGRFGRGGHGRPGGRRLVLQSDEPAVCVERWMHPPSRCRVPGLGTEPRAHRHGGDVALRPERVRVHARYRLLDRPDAFFMRLRAHALLSSQRGLCQRYIRRPHAVRSGMQRHVAGVALLLLWGCHASHERPGDRLPDATRGDGGARDAGAQDAGSVPDAGRRRDVGPCPYDTIIFPACNPTTEQLCHDRATAQAADAFPHATCVQLDRGEATCGAADACDAMGRCFCTPTRICASNEVCVSDTPEGPHRCRPVCSAD